MQRFINFLDGEPETPTSKEIIDGWQSEHERLPKDYLDFIQGYNGGFIYPDMFHHNVDDPDDWLDDVDDPTQLNHLYSWAEFVDHQASVGNVWRSEYVAIGEDITGNLILLKTAGGDCGGIYFWYRNNDSWDYDDGPVPIGRIAGSFREFVLKVLFPDDDGPDSRWTSFFKKGSAQKLEF